MSEREQPVNEWNAVTYLRDFINTELIITQREQAILDFIYNNYNDLPTDYLETSKYLPKTKYRYCFKCGELKPVGLFEGYNKICKECRRKKWKQ
jgi:hypothetical protein